MPGLHIVVRIAEHVLKEHFKDVNILTANVYCKRSILMIITKCKCEDQAVAGRLKNMFASMCL